MNGCEAASTALATESTRVHVLPSLLKGRLIRESRRYTLKRQNSFKNSLRSRRRGLLFTSQVFPTFLQDAHNLYIKRIFQGRNRTKEEVGIRLPYEGAQDSLTLPPPCHGTCPTHSPKAHFCTFFVCGFFYLALPSALFQLKNS